MKPTELRQLTESELGAKLNDFMQELFNLRFQTASHQAQNPKRIREVKKIIARIMTIQNERLRKASL
ncbi:MAG: 50S ribosomal protein L29 [bacterium]